MARNQVGKLFVRLGQARGADLGYGDAVRAFTWQVLAEAEQAGVNVHHRGDLSRHLRLLIAGAEAQEPTEAA